MPRMDKCRTRRLRKKLRVDEFQELGFEVSFELRDGLDEAQIDQFWDEFIVQSIEKNGLAFGGSTNGFVSAFGRGSTNEMHREIVEAWLKNRLEVESAQTGPLVDVWYGQNDDGL